MGPFSGQVPAQETRGGDKPDWAHAEPGEPLPERGETFPDPDSEQLPPGLDSWDEYPDGPDGYPDGYGDEDGPE